MRQAIDFLRLGQPTDMKGNQWRWKCPRCAGNDDRSLSVNLDKGYGCWVGASGNKPAHSGNDCIALAAHVLGITQTEAAKQLKEHFIGQRAPSAPKAPDGGGELQALVTWCMSIRWPKCLGSPPPLSRLWVEVMLHAARWLVDFSSLCG
jgi:hypothetical protein